LMNQNTFGFWLLAFGFSENQRPPYATGQ